MLLPTNAYPQFSDTHYEELLLSLCRKVVELQDSHADIDVIDYNESTEDKNCDIELSFKIKIVDSVIVAVAPNFTNFTFLLFLYQTKKIR